MKFSFEWRLPFSPSLHWRCWWRSIFPNNITYRRGSQMWVRIGLCFSPPLRGKRGEGLRNQHFFLFMATPAAYGSSRARGSNQSCSCQPMPHAQPCQIPAASPTYVTQLMATPEPQPTKQDQRPNPHLQGHDVGFLTRWATTGTQESAFLTSPGGLLM